MIPGSRGLPGRVRTRSRAFSIVEILVVVAIVGVLVALLLPMLSHARSSARLVRCASNQRQLAMAWAMYAADFQGRATPLAYTDGGDIGNGDGIFWWGSDGSRSNQIDFEKGFLAPYLGASLHEGSVFECPEQPWGSYRPQGRPRQITSTYGYNGYYLSPSKTPGWSRQIGGMRWQRVGDIGEPTDLLVFADAMIATSRGLQNTALLDPPRLFDPSSGEWTANEFPTTSFRHGGQSMRTACTVAARADGSAYPTNGRPEWYTNPDFRIGSAGLENDPHYVPDWRDWR